MILNTYKLPKSDFQKKKDIKPTKQSRPTPRSENIPKLFLLLSDCLAQANKSGCGNYTGVLVGVTTLWEINRRFIYLKAYPALYLIL